MPFILKHENAIEYILGRRAVVCYVDGSVKIFDLSTTAVTEKYDKPESSQVFISMDVHPDNNLVAVGSVNSQLCILKTQGTKVRPLIRQEVNLIF